MKGKGLREIYKFPERELLQQPGLYVEQLFKVISISAFLKRELVMVSYLENTCAWFRSKEERN